MTNWAQPWLTSCIHQERLCKNWCHFTQVNAWWFRDRLGVWSLQVWSCKTCSLCDNRILKSESVKMLRHQRPKIRMCGSPLAFLWLWHITFWIAGTPQYLWRTSHNGRAGIFSAPICIDSCHFTSPDLECVLRLWRNNHSGWWFWHPSYPIAMWNLFFA